MAIISMGVLVYGIYMLTAGIQWEHLCDVLWASVVMWSTCSIGGLSVVLYWSLYLVCYGVHDAGNGVLGDVVG